MSARTLIATTTLWLLRQIFIFVALLSLLGSELAKAQTVLLDDDFETDVPFRGSDPDGLPQPDFINWSVIEDTVDLLSDDPEFGFNSLCADALGIPDPGEIQCVDLDGSNNNAGAIETKVAFNLLPGTVRVMFDLAGSQRDLFVEPNTVTVSLSTGGGSVFSEDLSKFFDDPFETITRDIALAAPTAATLIFDHAGGDNVGLLLDNVKLIQLTVLALSKEITGGPDLPNRLEPNAFPQDPDDTPDGEIDLVVEVRQSQPTKYDFTITYSNPGVKTLVLDNVPGRWQITKVNDFAVIDGFLNSGIPTDDGNGGTGDVAVFPKNGRRDNKSSTEIEWRPDPDLSSSTLNVVVETRGKELVFNPQGCGLLLLNKGDLALEINPATGDLKRDPTTGDKLPPLFESSALVLASLEDVDGDGIIVRDGSGDEDGDGLTDIQEARDFDTNPCNPDTDLDGLIDGAEVGAGTDPINPDSDSDGALDGLDADPLDPTGQ